uniref:Uncharacterized protein n=1 Tax=Capitella teleta TaxID=283909 RepID=X2ABI8_CAPTE
MSKKNPKKRGRDQHAIFSFFCAPTPATTGQSGAKITCKISLSTMAKQKWMSMAMQRSALPYKREVARFKGEFRTTGNGNQEWHFYTPPELMEVIFEGQKKANQVLFSEIFKLMTTALVVMVGNAEAERVFSCQNRVKLPVKFTFKQLPGDCDVLVDFYMLCMLTLDSPDKLGLLLQYCISIL